MKCLIVSVIFVVCLVSAAGVQAQDEDRRKGRLPTAPPPAAAPQPPAAAATGQIVGQVVELSTGETLLDVVVRLEGSERRALTDIDGNFRFENLPPGQYSILTSYIGYEPKRVDLIQVKPNQSARLLVALKPEDLELETVVVSTAVRQQSELAVISMQRSSTVIMDGFSGDMILKQTPGFQLALALQRMPGVSMIDDRLLSIRGLYERYTNLTANEAILPYSDFERAGFDYSLIPAKLISSIAVVKSGRSDLTSEFAGGLIQLQTTDIPDENAMGVSLQLYYNDLGSFRQFRGYPSDRTSGWGFWPRVPNVNSSLPSTRELLALPQRSDERYQAVRGFNPDYEATTFNAPLGTNATFNLQRRFKIGTRDAGMTAAVSLLDHYTTEDTYVNVLDTYSDSLRRNPVADTSRGMLHRRSQNLTAMLNGGIHLRSGKITVHNLLVTNRNSYHYNSAGYVFDAPTGDTLQTYYFPIMRLTESTLWATQVKGKHRLSSGSSQSVAFDWDANAAHLAVREPSYRAITFIPGDSTDWVLNPVLSRADSSSPYTLSPYDASFTSRTQTTTLGGRFGVSIPLNQNFSVKTGVFTYQRIRRFRSRLLGPALLSDADDNPITDLTEAQRDRAIRRQLLAPGTYRPGGYDLYELTTGSHNYDGQRSTWAAYLMPQWMIGGKAFVQAGLRLENFSQRIDTLAVADESRQPLLENNLTELLPALNATYYLDARNNFRFAYSQTLIRPNERELVPLPFLDFLIGSMTFGNPDLLRTKVHNLDLKWENFGQRNQLVSANLFYKYFHLPMEQVFVSGEALDFATAVQNYQALNQSSAQAAGLELELRWVPAATFDWAALENLRFYGNLTLQRSRIGQASVFELVGGGGRPLQGQANYVINLGTVYELEESGWTAGLFYNRSGQRIAFVGAGAESFASIWELPRNVVDVQVGKRFGPLSLRLTLNDILNEPFQFAQLYDNRRTYDPNRDQIQKFVRRNFRLFLTLGYDF